MKGGRKKGVMGLGALIVFTAIMLVGAVIGIVLLTSGGSLQQKSMVKSQEGKKQVVSGYEVISVIGTDPSPSDATPHIVEHLHIMVRMLPGTITIPFNTTLIYIEYGTRSQTLVFNESCNGTCNAATTEKYNVYYLKQGTAYEADYLNMGDVAKVSIQLDGGVGEDTDMKILMIPANGPKTVIKIQTTNTMVASSTTLWPTS